MAVMGSTNARCAVGIVLFQEQTAPRDSESQDTKHVQNTYVNLCSKMCSKHRTNRTMTQRIKNGP